MAFERTRKIFGRARERLEAFRSKNSDESAAPGDADADPAIASNEAPLPPESESRPAPVDSKNFTIAGLPLTVECWDELDTRHFTITFPAMKPGETGTKSGKIIKACRTVQELIVANLEKIETFHYSPKFSDTEGIIDTITARPDLGSLTAFSQVLPVLNRMQADLPDHAALGQAIIGTYAEQLGGKKEDRTRKRRAQEPLPPLPPSAAEYAQVVSECLKTLPLTIELNAEQVDGLTRHLEGMEAEWRSLRDTGLGAPVEAPPPHKEAYIRATFAFLETQGIILQGEEIEALHVSIRSFQNDRMPPDDFEMGL